MTMIASGRSAWWGLFGRILRLAHANGAPLQSVLIRTSPLAHRNATLQLRRRALGSDLALRHGVTVKHA